MFTMGEDPLGMPEVGQSEPLLAAGFEDIKYDEHLWIREVDDGAVPLVSPLFILEPGAAVIEVLEGQEIDLLGSHPPVRAGVAEKIEDPLAGHLVPDAVPGFAFSLAHPDLLRPAAEAVVEVVLPVCPERARRHIIPVP